MKKDRTCHQHAQHPEPGTNSAAKLRDKLARTCQTLNQNRITYLLEVAETEKMLQQSKDGILDDDEGIGLIEAKEILAGVIKQVNLRGQRETKRIFNKTVIDLQIWYTLNRCLYNPKLKINGVPIKK